MSRTIYAIVSDTHGGNRYGLMNPNVELMDEQADGSLFPYRPSLTASQELMWEIYTEGISRLTRIASGDPIIAIHNGDILQGNKHPSALVSTRQADQLLIAEANMQPLLSIPNLKAFRIGEGTEAHNFGEGSGEIIVTKMLQNSFPAMDISYTSHGIIERDDYTVDYAHHGPVTGSRSWLRGNVARYYTQSLMLEEIVAGNVPPNLIVRSHYHQPIIERVDVGPYTSYLVITPSLCMLYSYGRQAKQSIPSVSLGFMAIEVRDGLLVDIHRLYRTIDLRVKETL